jgi:hypothetical protein
MLRKIAMFVVLGAVLAGCAAQEGGEVSAQPASSPPQAIGGARDAGAFSSERNDSQAFNSQSNDTEQPRAQIRGANLSVRVEKLEEAEKKVEDVVKENGGFEQNLTSSDLSGPNASLSIVAKVPV